MRMKEKAHLRSSLVYLLSLFPIITNTSHEVGYLVIIVWQVRRSLETGKSSEVINTNESSRLGHANGKNP